MLSKNTTFLPIKTSLYVRIPKALIDDSAFPFKKDEKISMRIEGKKLVITSTEKRK